MAYERRNRDLDPQLVWRGKDEKDWSDLLVQAPPLYIQEKVQPKVLIDDLMRETREHKETGQPRQLNLFADFNGIPSESARTEFYQHDANWSNRMVLGDSLQVMASLAERDGLRGQVQCIYIDPPYGIKFNSNFQWSTTNREVKDGKVDHITREPEQVKAFRDTWREGIHSYLAYLRDRLTVARDALTRSGSLFVQIGEENVHRIRVMMDEVFGEENFVAQVSFRKKLIPLGAKTLEGMADYLVWYARSLPEIKYRQLCVSTEPDPAGRWTGVQEPSGQLRRLTKEENKDFSQISPGTRVFGTVSQWAPSFSEKSVYSFTFDGRKYVPTSGRCWVTTDDKMQRLSAVFLARANPDARVLLSTFSDTLANALRTKLKRLISNEPRLGERVEVHAMNAIGRRLYELHFGQVQLASRETVRQLIDEGARAVGGHKFSLHFLMTEWEQVVDAWQLESWEAYRDVKHLGRKTRLPQKQRVVLWSIFDRVRASLKSRNLVTTAAVFSRLAAKLEGNKRPPFNFAVVDEAQDIAISQLRFLAALASDRLNSLFFAGDLGQRIFQQSFSWKALGIDVRGRLVDH